ncbi:hypothetical protein [Endozoicomonas sp. GU-1]|uniref:hypothetical protein n=1 Tax=Endozoicomonas sp. GU-1 TaxID=3009078 RepID=UPI0022B52BC7|nr:hypothetical protein [Endozoicomonas sp. GU-1]WBA88913.1 hypothetical protein O3276_02135 [Endozoicomonas sp. GU-1]
MYTPSWLSDQSLITSLLQEPWRWQAAQALRVLGQIPQPIDHRGDGRAQVSLRFACDPAYRFPCGGTLPGVSSCQRLASAIYPADIAWLLRHTALCLPGSGKADAAEWRPGGYV